MVWTPMTLETKDIQLQRPALTGKQISFSSAILSSSSCETMRFLVPDGACNLSSKSLVYLRVSTQSDVPATPLGEVSQKHHQPACRRKLHLKLTLSLQIHFFIVCHSYRGGLFLSINPVMSTLSITALSIFAGHLMPLKVKY